MNTEPYLALPAPKPEPSKPEVLVLATLYRRFLAVQIEAREAWANYKAAKYAGSPEPALRLYVTKLRRADRLNEAIITYRYV